MFTHANPTVRCMHFIWTISNQNVMHNIDYILSWFVVKKHGLDGTA
jgi:hypothetical protein